MLYEFNDLKKMFIFGSPNMEDTSILDVLKDKSGDEPGEYIFDEDIIKDSAIIILGGIGFGTKSDSYFNKKLNEINKFLKKINTYAFLIRGWDDPSYYDDERVRFSNFVAVSDYSVVKIPNQTCLCIGGDVSLDKAWKIEYQKLYGVQQYFKGEEPSFDKVTMKQIKNKYRIDYIASNIPPSFVGNTFDEIKKSKWVENDKKLYMKYINSKLVFDEIYLALAKEDNLPFIWVTKEFDLPNSKINGINFKGTTNFFLAINLTYIKNNFEKYDDGDSVDENDAFHPF